MSYQLPSSFLQKFSPKDIHELKRVFKMHDHDYCAAVPRTEVHQVLVELGEDLDAGQTNNMLQQHSLDHENNINFQQFLSLIYDYRTGAIELAPSMANVSVEDESSEGEEQPKVSKPWFPSEDPSSPSDNGPSPKSQWPPVQPADAPALPTKSKPEWFSAESDSVEKQPTPPPSSPKQGNASPWANTKPQWPPTHTSPVQKPPTPPASPVKPANASPWANTKPQWPPTHSEAVEKQPTPPASPPKPVNASPWANKKAQWPTTHSDATNKQPTPPASPVKPANASSWANTKPQWPATRPAAAQKPPTSPASPAKPVSASPWAKPKPQWPPAHSDAVEKAPAPPISPSKPANASPWANAKPQWPPAHTSPVEAAPVPGTPPSKPVNASPWAKDKQQWATSSPVKQGPPASPSRPIASQWPPRSPAKAKQWPPVSPSNQQMPPKPAPSTPEPAPTETPAATESAKALNSHAMSSLQRRSSTINPGNVHHGPNAKIHEVKGAAGGLHSYSEEEKVAFTQHINNTLQTDSHLQEMMPLDMNDGLFRSVSDGILLCKLINAAVPESIDERAMNFKKKNKHTLNVYEMTENLNLTINAAKAIGCSVVNIGPSDLIEGRPILVLGLVWQIIKIQLTSTINLKNHPELMRLLFEGESLDEFMKLPPDQILLRWVNYHLKAAGHPKTITNFSSDVRDAEAYSVLLHHIAPSTCDLCRENVPEERAAHVIENARKLDVETFIKPRDITSGNPKLNMSFVAQLFNTCPALEVVEEDVKQLEEVLYDDSGDTREERVFRLWINSLGIDDVYIHNLFADVREGLNLLKMYDAIEKGSVDWHRVNDPARNNFKKVENCNYCVDIGKRLKFSLVNIGGADIFDGSKKLILSIIWQAMRYHQLKLLTELAQGQGMGAVTDKDVLAWANQKVLDGGKIKHQIVAFKDPSLTDGKYLLDLVHAVEPRAVNWEQVQNGSTDEEKEMNAKYAISCAQKIGATVFLTYEDIVEVKPKMMMTCVASLMYVDMHPQA